MRWLPGLVALGLMGVSLPPATAASSVPAKEQTSSLPDTAVSIDLGDLLRGTIRFIQVANISDEEEVAIGRQINEMLLNRRYQLYPDRELNQYVDRIGQRLVAQSDRRDIPYTFQVVVSDNVNAFATPGGFVYVTTGLLRAVDNEAQLASVLAHEIAHINERHSIQALRRAVLAQGIAETAGLDMNTLARIGYQLALELPRSRSFEFEADRVGLEILQEAGYPPIAFVRFLEQLEERPYPPEFLRTHPVTANRIAALLEMIESEEAVGERGTNEVNYQRTVIPLL